MPKYLEAAGKTIDEAIEAALTELKLERDAVTVEILEKPKAGFLGIGAVNARVRVAYEDTPAARAEAYLSELLAHMNITAEVRHEILEGGELRLIIDGSDMGIVIGRRGETLDAIQFITALAVNRGQDEHVRIIVDTQDYRVKREESLVALANKVAARVQKYRKSMVLEPMNPHERRVIHSALQGVEGINTYSTGSDPNRRVVVAFGPPRADRPGRRPRQNQPEN